MRKALLLCIPIGLLIAFSLLASSQRLENQVYNFLYTDKPLYKATLCTYLKKSGSSEWVLLGCEKNTLTDIGKEHIEDQLINAQASSTANNLTYIALTNVSGACTSTSTNIQEITSGGLERAKCDFTDLGNGEWSCEHTFTASASHPNVQIGGYFWNGTAGQDNTLFACGSFTSVNLEENDQILVRWNVTISEA